MGQGKHDTQFPADKGDAIKHTIMTGWACKNHRCEQCMQQAERRHPRGAMDMETHPSSIIDRPPFRQTLQAIDTSFQAERQVSVFDSPFQGC